MYDQVGFQIRLEVGRRLEPPCRGYSSDKELRQRQAEVVASPAPPFRRCSTPAA